MGAVFGVAATHDLKTAVPCYEPIESDEATFLGNLIEQMRYERADGAPMATRLITTCSPQFVGFAKETMVEDTDDKNTEFSYNDFLCMLHKRVRAKAIE